MFILYHSAGEAVKVSYPSRQPRLSSITTAVRCHLNLSHSSTAAYHLAVVLPPSFAFRPYSSVTSQSFVTATVRHRCRIPLYLSVTIVICRHLCQPFYIHHTLLLTAVCLLSISSIVVRCHCPPPPSPTVTTIHCRRQHPVLCPSASSSVAWSALSGWVPTLVLPITVRARTPSKLSQLSQ